MSVERASTRDDQQAGERRLALRMGVRGARKNRRACHAQNSSGTRPTPAAVDSNSSSSPSIVFTTKPYLGPSGFYTAGFPIGISMLLLAVLPTDVKECVICEVSIDCLPARPDFELPVGAKVSHEMLRAVLRK